jgi:hypothetical protein
MGEAGAKVLFGGVTAHGFIARRGCPHRSNATAVARTRLIDDGAMPAERRHRRIAKMHARVGHV